MTAGSQADGAAAVSGPQGAVVAPYLLGDDQFAGRAHHRRPHRWNQASTVSRSTRMRRPVKAGRKVDHSRRLKSGFLLIARGGVVLSCYPQAMTIRFLKPVKVGIP
jgi:hypothetical protein